MSTNKKVETICCMAMILSLVCALLVMNAESLGIEDSAKRMEYETTLFDTSFVHSIDIQMEDWDKFIESCTDEEYALCSVVIDGESYQDVAIRAKGNTSLSQVKQYENDRYSFKIEFDHYDDGKIYHGLDKLVLNNLIQDNTYMKDYLTFQMMRAAGADAPLCSYINITVNGENWGLYLAVEGVEESFLQRNYGNDYGELYKPDSMNMGDNRGNEEKIDRGAEGDFKGGMGSSDVKLLYSDDEYDSYANIFDNAKTDLTKADKDRLIEVLKKLNNNEDIEDVVNVEEVIRYFVVHNFVCNFDSYTGSMIHNYYLYEKDGQLSMIPWDYNLAFGGFQNKSDATSLVNYPLDSPVSGGTIDSRPMLAWIFNKEEYTELYHQYFAEFISAYFDSGYFTEKMDSVKEMIAPYVENDATKFCTYEEFQTGVDTLKAFCLLRAESVSGQLDGTIAATAEGQEQDSTSLVDASKLDISAMGSMGKDMGGGMNREKNEFNPEPQTMETEDKVLRNKPPDNGQMPGAPDETMNNHTAMENPAAQNKISTETWLTLGACGIVLLVGLLAAKIYRRNC